MNDAHALLGAGQVELPARGRGPGVLVVAGDETSVGAVDEACRRLADCGFVAWAAEPKALEADPSEVVERLFRLDAVEGPRLAALGLGSGGGLALRAAQSARVAVALCLELSAYAGILDVERVDARVLLVCAEKDAVADPAGLRSLREALGAAGARVEVRVLPGAESGFLDPARADHYDASAARLAWDAALATLRAEL